MKKAHALALIAALLLISIAVSGCDSAEGFSIYLTKDNTPPYEMPALSQIELAEQPIISIDDIVSYHQETHEIELTSDAYQRLMALDITTSGMAFVACVDGQPIYWGAFWARFSSQVFDGIIIMVPLF
ncbi:MAG TPA: hypothetical protein G4N91_02130 [Dehalococcoidia bacterium]|nr:hypothetical protein [Dehalococcoidia bacterium]